jgi:predicted RNase H-like nuclease (RuvC/YqgF family)
MRDSNWFQKKWGRLDEVPMDDVYKRLSDLEITVRKLEEENIETSNALYELQNSIEAVDARIDILISENYNSGKFSLGK